MDRTVGDGREKVLTAHQNPTSSIWTPDGADATHRDTKESTLKIREAFESVSMATPVSRMVGANPVAVNSSSDERFPEGKIAISSDEDKFKISETVQSVLEHIGDIIDNPSKEQCVDHSDIEHIEHSDTKDQLQIDSAEPSENIDTQSKESYKEDAKSDNDLHKGSDDSVPKTMTFHTIFESVSKPSNGLKSLDNQNHSARRSCPVYQQYDAEKRRINLMNRRSDGGSESSSIFGNSRETSQRSTISPARSNQAPSTGRGVALFAAKSLEKKPSGLGRGSLLKLLSQ